jgi:pilus assembly protein FimV
VANKTNHSSEYLGLRSCVMAVASCLALSGIPLAAQAAGLGKIAVFSALGQTLRAEIEVSATREELSDMKAQLASPDAFKQAGLDYAATPLGIRFSLDKRANGQSVIKLTSDRAINDPFVDLLLELTWPTGRLVREYTFLLDPPEVAAKAAAVAPAAARPASAAIRPAAPERSPAPIDDALRSKAVAIVQAQQGAPQAAPQAAEPPVRKLDGREVKRGDTLNKIATELKPEGVSLDQMLVGLLRANQDAFDGGNMNRLKAGKILSLPEKSAIEAVSTVEARKIVIAQSSNWNAYRSKLAGVASQTPVSESSASQESAGKITAKVEDKAGLAAQPKDQLKVSTADKAASRPGAAQKRSEEDQIAKEKALAEARQRLVTLEKNVADLQSLVELKNQNLAQLQKQAAEKTAPVEKPAEPVAPPAPVAAPPAAKPEPVAAAIEKPVEPPVEAKAPEAIKPEAKPEPIVEPKPVEAAKPKSVPPPPPPQAEPGLFNDILGGMLDNPLALAGSGGILALIAALVVMRRRRASQGEVPLTLGGSLSEQFSGMTANSIFRSTGGQSVDTSHGPAQTDFSQAGPGSIDTDEVDPVAEADVYMAYGRDVQAEEILVEARQKDPKRYAIHLKLLEIYANRKDLKQFETLATDLYSETGGVGADWEKAAAMGVKLDPDNPLYGTSVPAAVAVAPAAFDANATLVVAAPPAMRQTVVLPGELSQLADEASAAQAPELPVADLMSLDFDLGLGDEKAEIPAESAKTTDEATLKLPEPSESPALDFDLATESFVNPPAEVPIADLDFDFPEIMTTAPVAPDFGNVLADLDFDLGVEPGADEVTAFQARTAEAPMSDGDLDTGLDARLSESTFLGQTVEDVSSFDMSSIDLDLNGVELAAAPPASPPATDPGVFPDLQFESVEAPAAVNVPDLNFETVQAETQITPSPLADLDFPAEKDFSIVQGETQLNPQFAGEPELPQEADLVASEDVTTKLDLAKAYEEMGDFEGARELLQEVLIEGDATQRAKAQFILAKIGE